MLREEQFNCKHQQENAEWIVVNEEFMMKCGDCKLLIPISNGKFYSKLIQNLSDRDKKFWMDVIVKKGGRN